ncbi:MAG: protein kinase [Elusimicrobia bacterium]|nr:protein kinase [Elusimicrobiota bacterium]
MSKGIPLLAVASILAMAASANAGSCPGGVEAVVGKDAKGNPTRSCPPPNSTVKGEHAHLVGETGGTGAVGLTAGQGAHSGAHTLPDGGNTGAVGGQTVPGGDGTSGGLQQGGVAKKSEGDLTADQLRALLDNRNQQFQQQYGSVLGGKYAAIGDQMISDLHRRPDRNPDRKFDSTRYNGILDMIDAEFMRRVADEDPALDKDPERRARLQAEAEAALEKAHAVLMRHNDAPSAGVVSPHTGNPMDWLHRRLDERISTYKPPVNPANPAPPPPVNPRSRFPSPKHIADMLRSNPQNTNNWSLDAQQKLSQGDKAGGLASLNKAIALGGNAEALGLRGAMRLEAHDYDGAYQDAKKGLELNPGDKNLLGILRSAEGRTTPGLASSGGSGGSGSGGGAAYENRGGGSAGFGGFDPGRTREIPGMTTAATLASNQKLDEARRALALGDFGAAIALAQRALELNPNNAGAHNFLSGVYARTGDYKRAIASANAGLALAPRDAALLNNKAFAENRSKLYRDALGTSNGAIEADSRNAYSYANRAYAYGGLGDKESMMSDINRAAGIDPRFEEAAAEAAGLQLPSNADILFMFPGENPDAPAAAPPARSRSFGVVVGAGLLGGLLLALGLLSTVLAPLKESVVSAFTKATRRGPSVHALEEEATPEAAPAAEAAGVIRGQYEIVRQIGAGGMGMVYEGTDRSLGRRVAIKKMRDELRINPRERERFVIEAKTVASLHHGNIVDIYAIAEEGEDVYLVFEYVDGKTIHELVQSQGRLSPSDSVRVTRAMGDALTYAHSRGVIHRDMKPSNVMLTSDGRIKVMDFGIARMAKDALTRYSMTNTVVGTPPYMAPEQEQGVVRKESDVYSLAICSYEMLTGKLPFIGVAAGMLMNKINMSYIPPSRAIAGLPESLDEVFLKAFQADPDQRYRTPQEFASALEAAFGGARSSPKPV